MSIKSKLDFIASCSDFDISKHGDEYRVTFIVPSEYDTDLVAFIKPSGDIEYAIEGVYNIGCNYASIDIGALEELKTFCEMLVKENNI